LPRLEGEFEELQTAKAWGLTPRQWRGQTLDDRALMMALDMAMATREAYRIEFKEKQKRDKDGNGLNSMNDFTRMKRAFGMD
jgi:hypothetical protein